MNKEDKNSVSASRRGFMKAGAVAGGGLVFGFSLFGCSRGGDGKEGQNDRKEKPSETAVGQAATAASEPAGLAHDAFIRIDREGIVTLIVHKVEMGQGTFTSMPTWAR
jgi:isoquinoline 1-oxidoreductase beta subunit